MMQCGNGMNGVGRSQAEERLLSEFSLDLFPLFRCALDRGKRLQIFLCIGKLLGLQLRLGTQNDQFHLFVFIQLIDKSDKSRPLRVRRTLGGTPFQTGVFNPRAGECTEFKRFLYQEPSLSVFCRRVFGF